MRYTSGVTDDLVERAARAYMRSDSQGGVDAPYPSMGGSYVDGVGDKEYVILTNVSGVLAVFRIKNDGRLKRLKRWPKALGV